LRERLNLNAVDLIVLAYTAAVGLFVLLLRERVPESGSILLLHAFVLIVLPLLPARGAPWETSPPGEAGVIRRVRATLRFLRYTYLLFFVLFYFEEVRHTVNALWQESPYWFEPFLYDADRFLFGELPTELLNDVTGLVLDEVVHFFYFSYFFIFIGGVIIAWFRRVDFDAVLTSVITGFFLCFSQYPFLPARGPWENPELMASVNAFEGIVFVPIIEAIMKVGAVSGGCFPSSHVAGSWATAFAMWPRSRAWSVTLGVLAIGMSASCVYTRYHHFVDVPTGFVMGALGAVIGHAVVKRSQSRS
jgi:membrane-associated phospholipid phosphatase